MAFPQPGPGTHSARSPPSGSSKILDRPGKFCQTQDKRLPPCSARINARPLSNAILDPCQSLQAPCQPTHALPSLFPRPVAFLPLTHLQAHLPPPDTSNPLRHQLFCEHARSLLATKLTDPADYRPLHHCSIRIRNPVPSRPQNTRACSLEPLTARKSRSLCALFTDEILHYHARSQWKHARLASSAPIPLGGAFSLLQTSSLATLHQYTTSHSSRSQSLKQNLHSSQTRDSPSTAALGSSLVDSITENNSSSICTQWRPRDP